MALSESKVVTSVEINSDQFLAAFHDSDVVLASAVDPGLYAKWTDKYEPKNWESARLGIFDAPLGDVTGPLNRTGQFRFKKTPSLGLFTLVSAESGKALHNLNSRCLGRPVISTTNPTALRDETLYFAPWALSKNSKNGMLETLEDGNIQMRLRMFYRLPGQLKRYGMTMPLENEGCVNIADDNLRGLRRQPTTFVGTCWAAQGEFSHEQGFLNLPTETMLNREAKSDEWFIIRTIRPATVIAPKPMPTPTPQPAPVLPVFPGVPTPIITPGVHQPVVDAPSKGLSTGTKAAIIIAFLVIVGGVSVGVMLARKKSNEGTDVVDTPTDQEE